MRKRTQEKSVAFFERNSWYHRTKTLDENGNVKYGKKGGFSSRAEAEKSYRKYEEEFNRQFRKPHIIILSKPKIKILLQAASKTNWYLEILLGLFCGLRKGEIYGLKFSDFDMENRTVEISRQIVANPVIKKDCRIEDYGVQERDPKTPNSFRILRVPEIILSELEKRKVLVDMDRDKLGADYQDNGYICCQGNGQVHSLSAMNIALRKLCVRNGLPSVTVHGLRHMFATILIEQGVSLAKISDVYGDTSQIIEDCLAELQPFIDEVIPPDGEQAATDYSKDDYMNCLEALLEESSAASD